MYVARRHLFIFYFASNPVMYPGHSGRRWPLCLLLVLLLFFASLLLLLFVYAIGCESMREERAEVFLR